MSNNLLKETEPFMPIIYIPKEREGKLLIEALIEKNSQNNYYIFWYHWPFNDYSNHEDFEPIILFTGKNGLSHIGMRPGNRYVYSRVVCLQNNRPVIVFDTPWHHPRHFPLESLRLAVAKTNVFHLCLTTYKIHEGKPPSWYISADSGQSVYDWADDFANDIKRGTNFYRDVF
jgi:hypothetical protein